MGNNNSETRKGASTELTANGRNCELCKAKWGEENVAWEDCVYPLMSLLRPCLLNVYIL